MKMKFQTCTLFIFLLFSTRFSFAQNEPINLIPNPGFEDINICTKYQEACYPEAWHSSTLKAFYYKNDQQKAKNKEQSKEGLRYVSICMYNEKRKFDRGFLQTPLLCELEAGKTYELSFYYKTVYKMIDHFGVVFKDTLLIKTNNDHLEGIQPSIRFQNKNFIPPNKWILVKETYKAKGGESVLMIGNFSRDKNTKVIQIGKQSKSSYDNMKSSTYYLFDEFKLVALDTEIKGDIENNRKMIYGDDVRHTIPVQKEEPLATVIAAAKPESKPEFLVIEEDSILISETFELPNILFDIESDHLLSIAYPALKKLGNYLLYHRQSKIFITGHTDDQGSDIFNQNLSLRRAKAVHDYLLSEGVSKNRIHFEGKGEREPLSLNSTEEGRAKNRRVEFKLIKE
ncbi:MAG: OOP family OmpA-OmpF porin [Saprospiraceae bacterium]|jgi:OOP family OmpA-OmpF porin